MRHFGEPTQDLRQDNANDGSSSLNALTRDNQTNLARLIHDRFSPANLYEHTPYAQAQAAGSQKASAYETVQSTNKEAGREINFNVGANPYESDSRIAKPAPAPSPSDRVALNPMNFLPPVERTMPITALPQVQQPQTHPLMASLRRPEPASEARFPVPGFTQRSESGSREELALRLVTDFKPSIFDSKFGIRHDVMGKDPFSAPNCYQSYQINAAEGWSRTVTTLPDLSASKIESRYQDRNTVTYTDRLGRPERETVLDKQGNVLTETISRFEHPASPTVPSYKRVKTANETIELTLDAQGIVTSKYTV